MPPRSGRPTLPAWLSRHLSFWLLPPLALSAYCLWGGLYTQEEANHIWYQGAGVGDQLTEPPTVEDFARYWRFTPAEFQERTRGYTEAERNRYRNFVQQRIAEAPQLRAKSIADHDRWVEENRQESRIAFLLAAGFLLTAPLFSWVARKATRGLGRFLEGSPDPKPLGPRARLQMRDGTSHSAAAVYAVTAGCVLCLLVAALLFLHVVYQPPGQSNFFLLMFVLFFGLTGMLATPRMLHAVMVLRRQQRELDQKIAGMKEATDAFRRQTAHGSAAVDAGSRLSARDDEFRVDLPRAAPPPSAPSPAPPSASRPAAGHDQFRIDLPPGKGP
ncbi:Hypothetical protein RADP37_05496 (plasmid) [Roseomonas mucosa]|uniref:Uncharacterized protein n=1 Tax=Roseomonas mucosa TaxID=207340 RepID=A0A4Y1MR71_9PROT|nr:Hypothetical protein RADP37_05496 [Roseomonas mucosa]